MIEGVMARRLQRQQLDQARHEAYEAWQREQEPVLLAREVLDPQAFMYRRAAQLVREERQKPIDSDGGPDPLTDMLGGARMAAACAEAGLDTREARNNHYNDIRTAFTESLFKGGHVSSIMAELNGRGEAAVVDLPHWELFLRNAQKGNPEAVIAEVAEEFYSAALYHSSYRDTHDMYVLSPARADTIGNTLMIRQISFQQEMSEGKRRTQQLYIDNSHTGDINQLLRELGILHPNQPDMSELEILGQPLLVRRSDFPEAVMSFAIMLDQIAAERTDRAQFCGVRLAEPASYQHYMELPEQSRRREQQMEQHITNVAEETLRLVTSRVLSYGEENERFIHLFINSLRQICIDHPEYAEAAFGKEAAAQYMTAHLAKERGDIAAADQALALAMELSQSVDFCDTTISLATTGAVAEVSAYASLETKYGSANLLRGACIACQKGNERQKLGPCGFCSDCDRQDRLQPGYIQQLINQQTNRLDEVQTIPDSSPISSETLPVLRLHSGQRVVVGDEVLEYRQQLVFGGTNPQFIRANGETIEGEIAKELVEVLQAA